MSVQAGTILHIGGNNIIDRIQSAGFGNTKMPIEAIREVGNMNIVDKVPGDPDFTFTMESFDVSTEIEAWLTGKVGGGTPTTAPGYTDPDGTAYPINGGNCQHVNVVSPWRDPTSSAGTIQAGHIVPGYYPTAIRYRFGATDNASESVDLQGSSFYYHESAPVEEFRNGDGATVTFSTASAAVPYRENGIGNTVFRSIFGVIVDGVLMTKGVDYTTTPTNSASPATASVTFNTAPKAGTNNVRFAYFTTASKNYPPALNSSAVVKPAAVRGRNICVYLGSGGTASQLGAVQSVTLDYTVQGQVERELCSPEVTGYTVLGTDVTGEIVIRARNIDQLFSILAKVTGISRSEVFGWLNINPIPLSIKIQNPRNTGQILKTLYVSDAMFDMPDSNTRVNTPVDYTIGWQSQTGTFAVYKGDSGF